MWNWIISVQSDKCYHGKYLRFIPSDRLCLEFDIRGISVGRCQFIQQQPTNARHSQSLRTEIELNQNVSSIKTPRGHVGDILEYKLNHLGLGVAQFQAWLYKLIVRASTFTTSPPQNPLFDYLPAAQCSGLQQN